MKLQLELEMRTIIDILTLFHNRNDVERFEEIILSMLTLPKNWKDNKWHKTLLFVIQNRWGDVCDANKSLELMESWCHKLHIKRMIGGYPKTERKLQMRLHALYSASLIFATNEEKESLKSEFFELIQEYKIEPINQLLQEEKGEE